MAGLHETTRGGLLVFAAAVGFGTLAVFGKLAAAVELATSTLLLFRFVVGTAIVCAVVGYHGRVRRPTRRGLASAVALGTLYGLMSGLFFWGLEFLSAGLTAIVFYTYPIHVFVISSIAMNERVTRLKVAALVVATTGVGSIVGTSATDWSPFAVFLVLSAATGYATYVAGSRAILPSVDGTTFTVVVLISATGSTVPFGFLLGGLAIPVGVHQWLVVVGTGVVGTAVPIGLFLRGLERIEASRASVVGTSEPVATVLLGALVLGEPLTTGFLVGSALVLSGALLVQRAGEPTTVVVN